MQPRPDRTPTPQLSSAHYSNELDEIVEADDKTSNTGMGAALNIDPHALRVLSPSAQSCRNILLGCSERATRIVQARKDPDPHFVHFTFLPCLNSPTSHLAIIDPTGCKMDCNKTSTPNATRRDRMLLFRGMSIDEFENTHFPPGGPQGIRRAPEQTWRAWVKFVLREDGILMVSPSVRITDVL